jgi:hypothetical protein
MRFCKAALAILLLGALAACGNTHVAGVAFEPNPPPPPGFTAVCGSTPLPFNAFVSNCTPAQMREERVVVRAKG